MDGISWKLSSGIGVIALWLPKFFWNLIEYMTKYMHMELMAKIWVKPLKLQTEDFKMTNKMPFSKHLAVHFFKFENKIYFDDQNYCCMPKPNKKTPVFRVTRPYLFTGET